MAESALGIRVKSGWASAVLIGDSGAGPQFLHRARLDLADPRVPKSAQPYHHGFGRLQKNAAILERLTAVVRTATAEALSTLVGECARRGHAPSSVALVVGSTIAPERITNEHIRAHALEARLFRTALEDAAVRLNLPTSVTRERDLADLARRARGGDAAHATAALGIAAGRPWRADEKLAALAAWVALAKP